MIDHHLLNHQDIHMSNTIRAVGIGVTLISAVIKFNSAFQNAISFSIVLAIGLVHFVSPIITIFVITFVFDLNVFVVVT